MKPRKCRLEFGIITLSDIRFLLRVWRRFWIDQGKGIGESGPVDITMEHRVPGEELFLNFTLTPEELERFLTRLGEEGLKFTCDEIVPRMYTTCRLEQERF